MFLTYGLIVHSLRVFMEKVVIGEEDILRWNSAAVLKFTYYISVFFMLSGNFNINLQH